MLCVCVLYAECALYVPVCNVYVSVVCTVLCVVSKSPRWIAFAYVRDRKISSTDQAIHAKGVKNGCQPMQS